MPDLNEMNGDEVLQHAVHYEFPQGLTLGQAVIEDEFDKVPLIVN